MVVTKLDFTYDGMDKPVLKKFDLDLPKGSRCDTGGRGTYLWVAHQGEELFVVVAW